VPVWNPIKPAMDALFLFMDEHMPKTAVDAKETLRTEMMRSALILKYVIANNTSKLLTQNQFLFFAVRIH
jgi:hypothetical protein